MAAADSVSPDSSRLGLPETSQDPGALSGLDSQLFQYLQADGRASYSALARKLGVSEVTVRRRVARLIEDGIFTITAVADPRLLGLDQMAWTALSVHPGAASRIAEQLVGFPQVTYVVQTSGRYGVMAELGCSDQPELRQALAAIRKIPGVQRTETFTYLAMLHQQFVWGDDDLSFSGVVGLGQQMPDEQLDPVDREIIRQLQIDGRLPFRIIADRLGISERLASQRFRWLVDNRLVRVMAVGNPESLGYRTRCWLAMQCSPQLDSTKVAQQVARVHGIDYVVATTGRYDLMAELVSREKEELVRTVEELIGHIDGVEHCEVFYYLRLLYRSNVGAWGASRAQDQEARR
jgi:DNA-binding Lrp family transcriptional regulator